MIPEPFAQDRAVVPMGGVIAAWKRHGVRIGVAAMLLVLLAWTWAWPPTQNCPPPLPGGRGFFQSVATFVGGGSDSKVALSPRGT
jgi:hypothetical protein